MTMTTIAFDDPWLVSPVHIWKVPKASSFLRLTKWKKRKKKEKEKKEKKKKKKRKKKKKKKAKMKETINFV